MADGKVLAGQATPRGRYPHVKRAGDFVYVSGTSARRPDNTIAGAEVDAMGTTALDIRVQTRAVIENIREMLAAVGADARRPRAGDHVPGQHERLRRLQRGLRASSSTQTGPARTTVAVHQLPHPHLLIEIQARRPRSPQGGAIDDHHPAQPINFPQWIERATSTC